MTAIEQYLRERDRLSLWEIAGKPLYLHEDHRWVLPLIAEAQEQGRLPRPCTLIGFDHHHDGLVPGALQKIRGLVRAGFTAGDVVELCAGDLRSLDDDWIIAGIELGLLKDVVLFGVEDTDNQDDPRRRWRWEGYEDHLGMRHTVWTSRSLPGEMLGHQGSLCNPARSAEWRRLWEALGWGAIQGVFDFCPDAAPILLDIDLDCFAVEIRGCLLAWPDEVMEQVFETPGYGAAASWTGRRFMAALVSRAAMITVAREHGCCGGEDVADAIWLKVQRLLTS